MGLVKRLQTRRKRDDAPIILTAVLSGILAGLSQPEMEKVMKGMLSWPGIVYWHYAWY